MPGAGPCRPSLASSPPPHSQSPDRYAMAQRDFGVIPIPGYLRHVEGKEVSFGVAKNVVLGAFATFTVSNLYYCQPILNSLASSFGVSDHQVSNIPTLVQAGYAAGLLTITPLGDLVQRRQLILLLTALGAALTIGLAITNSLVVFEVITCLVGYVSVVPQILVPLAADLAPMDRKAGAIAIVWAALMLGVLFARVLSGVIANFSDYKNVYWMATGLQFATLLAAFFFIPNVPRKNVGLNYFGILGSMGKLAVTQPLLIQAALGVLVSNMCFTNFWVTLTFLLKDAPFRYSDLDIGLFGLLGMLGVLLGPFLGRSLDFVFPWWGALFAAFWLLVFQAVMVIGAGLNIAPVIIATLGTDVFRQMTSVSNTAMVFSKLDPAARARMNAVLVVAIFVGQVIGTSASTTVFLNNGWRACYGMALGWTAFQVVILFARGPHLPTDRWLGWAGGWKVRKPRPAAAPPVTQPAPTQAPTPVTTGGEAEVEGTEEKNTV